MTVIDEAAHRLGVRDQVAVPGVPRIVVRVKMDDADVLLAVHIREAATLANSIDPPRGTPPPCRLESRWSPAVGSGVRVRGPLNPRAPRTKRPRGSYLSVLLRPKVLCSRGRPETYT